MYIFRYTYIFEREREKDQHKINVSAKQSCSKNFTSLDIVFLNPYSHVHQ